MKRLLSVVVVLMAAAAAFGSNTTHRYIVAMKPTAHAHARQLNGVDLPGRDVESLPYLNAYIADLTGDELLQLQKDSDVRYVEDAEITFRAIGMNGPVATTTSTATPLDATSQVMPWGIARVHAPDVWSVERGDGINVAVVDTGIDYTHPDLKAAYQGGFNAITKSNDPKDDANPSHGTHVAGTIAAADNGLGVVGVAPNVKLWGVKVLGATGSGTNGNIASGLNWVLSQKASVGGNWIVNMSLGECTDPAPIDPDTTCSSAIPFTFQDACQQLANAGVLIFAASGNESDTTKGHIAPVAYPAAFPSVVAVGALDASSTVATFSDQGPQVAVTAPGVGVLSTLRVGSGFLSTLTADSASYESAPLTGSKQGTISGPFVYCGLGKTAADFPAAVKGKIALIQRGDITFNLKTRNAVAAGAIGVVIFNKEAGPFSGTLLGANPTEDDKTFAWPITIGISLEAGQQLLNTPTATLSLSNAAGDYGFLDGTSMACPHAVGVAALVWAADPTASAADVKNAIFGTATDLGDSGKDNAYGFGLINAYAAAKALAPSKFGTPVQTLPVPGRRVLRRGH